MLTKSDIAMVGYYVYPIKEKDYDGTCFRCRIETAGIEQIILLETLCMNGSYYITNDMIIVNRDEGWVEFHTDFPYEEYVRYAKFVKFNPLYDPLVYDKK